MSAAVSFSHHAVGECYQAIFGEWPEGPYPREFDIHAASLAIIGEVERLRARIADLYSLGLMAEEAGEIVQLVGKALRFGMDAPGPDAAPYHGKTARQLLPIEVGDMGAAVEFAIADGVLDPEIVHSRLDAKLARLLDPASTDSSGGRLAPEVRGPKP